MAAEAAAAAAAVELHLAGDSDGDGESELLIEARRYIIGRPNTFLVGSKSEEGTSSQAERGYELPTTDTRRLANRTKTPMIRHERVLLTQRRSAEAQKKAHYWPVSGSYH